MRNVNNGLAQCGVIRLIKFFLLYKYINVFRFVFVIYRNVEGKK